MTFMVGQRVVCVDDSNGDIDSPLGAGYDFGLRKGKVYEIVAFTRQENLVLSGVESGWLPIRFRPIVSRKTDISALKALLVPGAKIRETA
jgi:hypothetical protein